MCQATNLVSRHTLRDGYDQGGPMDIIILLNAGWFRFYTHAWFFTVNVAFFELAPHAAKALDRIVEPSILSAQSETGTVLQMFPALFLLVPRSLSLSRFAFVIYNFLVVAIAMAAFQCGVPKELLCLRYPAIIDCISERIVPQALILGINFLQPSHRWNSLHTCMCYIRTVNPFNGQLPTFSG